MKKNRTIWVDDVKVVSCILVVLGHLFQSLVKSGILFGDNLYQWFNKTIYCFHVQLFFICSGYLYQKFNKVNSFHTWCFNARKKFVALGIPYFAFSTVTWMLKTVLSGLVNGEVDGYFVTLFLKPTAPYWFLYTLFFIFISVPTFSNRKMMFIGLGIATILKYVSILDVYTEIYVVDSMLSHIVWFVFGMFIAMTEADTKMRNLPYRIIGGILSGLVLLLSLQFYFDIEPFTGGEFILGMLACTAVILNIMPISRQNKIVAYLSQYTMPIFLMHTIFAAPVRIVMMKLGIESLLIHIVVGLLISFVGPIAAAEVMKHIKWLDVFLYPNKYIKLNYGAVHDKKSVS